MLQVSQKQVESQTCLRCVQSCQIAFENLRRLRQSRITTYALAVQDAKRFDCSCPGSFGIVSDVRARILWCPHGSNTNYQHPVVYINQTALLHRVFHDVWCALEDLSGAAGQ